MQQVRAMGVLAVGLGSEKGYLDLGCGGWRIVNQAGKREGLATSAGIVIVLVKGQFGVQ